MITAHDHVDHGHLHIISISRARLAHCSTRKSMVEEARRAGPIGVRRRRWQPGVAVACSTSIGTGGAMASDDGFEEFYQTTRHRVVTMLYALSGNLADAQDACQEAYARAWQRWDTVASYGDPEAWVRTVGYRLALNRLRKIRNSLTAYRRHGPVPDAGPPSETTVALIAALRELPEEQRLAIVLHHLLDLSVADVAAQTGANVNTVKARLVRGRRALAQRLGQAFPEGVTHA
jgi:RNA polymerase sigma-70 factor (ECF subfamily)